VTELPFPPKYGEHTQSVLSEAGYSSAQLEQLVATGIVTNSQKIHQEKVSIP
jgi:hypothetical protein